MLFTNYPITMPTYHLFSASGARDFLLVAEHRGLGCKAILMFMLLLSFCADAQTISQQIQTYAGQLRQSQSVAIPLALREDKNAKEVIEVARQYFADTLWQVRAKMYALVGEIGAKSRDQNLRQQAVGKLVNATADLDNLDLLLSRLSAFNGNDFGQPARDTLVSRFRKNPPYLDQLARLCGDLGIMELKDDLKAMSGPATKNQRTRWAALLALARMGDAEALNGIMKRVQRLPVNDDVVYEIFPDLIYTRQRPAIDYLIVELNKDEKKCSTADDMPVTCAYRIMEILAEVIEKYPLQADVGGDIKTKDYEKSLATVRQWFKKNKEYQIKQ